MIRSSHALLTDRADIADDATTTKDLFEALKDEDCVLYAHIGGRPANIAQADGGWLRTSLEVHSDWGTFEWVMKDSFELGYRHGLVCNSDGHKGRPGASHPGASSFGALGGLTCFLTPELSRDGIFDAMRRRHHYGTTGGRLHLDVSATLENPARVYERDPRVGDAAYAEAHTLMMGDIAAVQDDQARVFIRAETQSPLLAVDILRGTEVLERCLPYGLADLGRRHRICFHGAEYRGRGRQTTWAGQVQVKGANITRFETLNAWNHDRKLDWSGADLVEFDLLTTGNIVGFDIWLDGDADSLDIATTLVSENVALNEVSTGSVVLDAGGLDRKVTVTQLPDSLDNCSYELERDIALNTEGDTPIWVRVETEDGHLAWSSPIYLFKQSTGN